MLPATQAPPTNKDSPTIDAQPSISTSILPHRFKASKLFDALCPGLNVLTDDVAKNASFMSCVKASEGSILHFMKLRSMYAAKNRVRKTQLKKDLEKVDAAIISVQHITRKVSSISVNPSISLDLLTQRSVEKQQLLKDLGQSLFALMALVACPQLITVYVED